MKKYSSQQDVAFKDLSGRYQVSNPYSIFDSKLINDKQPLFYSEVINNAVGASSTHNFGEASVSMVVSGNGDYVIRQTFMRFNYQTGKTQTIILTGVMGDVVPNTESKIGYFNTSTVAPYTASEDGIYFGQDGTNKYVAVSKNGSQNKIIQSKWNIDKLDGSKDRSNKSYIDLKYVANQVFYMKFLWLGVSMVEFGLKLDDVFIPCHIEFYSNNIDLPTGAYLASPNHSIRYEIRSTGGANTMKHMCSTVISEGGVEPSGISRGFSNGLTTVAVGTTTVGLLFIRINANKPCTTVDIDEFTVFNLTNNANNFQYFLIRNPTIAGVAPTFNNLSNSAIDFAVGVSANQLTGGQVLYDSYASGKTPTIKIDAKLIVRLGISIAGVQDVFAIGCRTFVGTDIFVSSANAREITCG